MKDNSFAFNANMKKVALGKTMTTEQIVTKLFGSHLTTEESERLEKSVKILIEEDRKRRCHQRVGD
ncbi:hypothetical protein [Pediococcus pentosaceus]|uniref:hypothetical protein n=1 Tax=Pediococcus pentosaceus TaxID=1255 RepID=UPI00223C1C69|nr:hypothetical protein [Pediococcus pentosaceus]MCT1175672.1 hypothetical protein [Pediococcus pentosaceus]